MPLRFNVSIFVWPNTAHDMHNFNYTLYYFSRSYKFTNKDAFIGYQDETPATVVYHATQQVKQLKSDMLDHRELSNNNFNPSFSSCLCESNNSEESWGEMVC